MAQVNLLHTLQKDQTKVKIQSMLDSPSKQLFYVGVQLAVNENTHSLPDLILQATYRELEENWKQFNKTIASMTTEYVKALSFEIQGFLIEIYESHYNRGYFSIEAIADSEQQLGFYFDISTDQWEAAKNYIDEIKDRILQVAGKAVKDFI